MANAYFYRYIVLKSGVSGGIFSMENRKGKIKLQIDARTNEKTEGPLKLALFTKDGVVSKFTLRGLHDTLYVNKLQLDKDLGKYIAAAVIDEGKNGKILLRGENQRFDWAGAISTLQREQAVQAAVVEPKAMLNQQTQSRAEPAEPATGQMQAAFPEATEVGVRPAEEPATEEVEAEDEMEPIALPITEEEASLSEVMEKEVVVTGFTQENETEKVVELETKRDEARDFEQTYEKKETAAEESMAEPPVKEAIGQENEFEGFQKRWPGSEWRKVYYPGTRDKYYLVGKIYENGVHVKDCYAVSGMRGNRRSRGDAYFENKGQGYWLMFQEVDRL